MKWVKASERIPPDYKPVVIRLVGSGNKYEDCFAIVTYEGWYWWVDGVGDEVEGKVEAWLVPDEDWR